MRSRDRLEELRRIAGYESGPSAALLPEPAAKPPAPEETQTDQHKELTALLDEVTRTRGWIVEIARNTQLVRCLHADNTYHTNQQLQDHLDAAVTMSNACGLKVAGALRQLGATAGASGAAGAGAVSRAARLQLAATRLMFADALRDHHAALDALHSDKRSLLRAQIKLMNLTVSDDECETLLENDNIALFVDNVRAETAEARRALRDVEARHAELQRVERSLTEVRDLFTQLMQHVADQQEQIDRVEYYALQAGEYVESGGQQLLKGSVSRARASQKKIGLIICLASGFLIVLLVLIFT